MYLFICTGNYYRSRFAEYYFNFRAEQLQLPARAFSRGLEAAAARNSGPVSVYTITYMEALQIPQPPVWTYPVQLEETDFDRASRVIALDETEHRPMILRNFPHRLAQLEFWQFPDIQFAEPAEILPAIRQQIDQLIAHAF